jgi:hypothetical protein
MGGRPPGSPNKPYDSSKELFFERHIETAIADKFCDLVAGMVGDLGGWDNLAVGQLQLIRRCAMISTKCEIMEREAAEGKPFDSLIYSMLTNTLTRALKALGLKELNARPEQTIIVQGHLPDLPLPDDDSATGFFENPVPAPQPGPNEGPTYSIKPAPQAAPEEFGAAFGHRQHRESAA